MKKLTGNHPLGAFLATVLLLSTTHLPLAAQATTEEELVEKVARLERELAESRAALEALREGAADASTTQGANDAAARVVADVPLEEPPPAPDEGLKIGGAIRVNYTAGDYGQQTSGTPTSATRGGSGAVALDTFRLNLDYQRGPWLGKAEYRSYPGYSTNNNDSYHFPHTAWIGYAFDSGDRIELGLNRSPFGPGPYGISKSWLFDQHYYAGLSDNMNLGVKYTLSQVEDWTWDFAYYAAPAPNGGGNNFGRRSSRYSYNVVDETGLGYDSSHQFNVRGIHTRMFGEVKAELGGSLQYGILDSNGRQGNGSRLAGSLHGVFSWNQWQLATQLTYSDFNVNYQDAAGNTLTRDVVVMGAYDFPTEVAAEAWIPAVSLSYQHQTDSVDWLDSITPYLEYSSLVKRAGGFNDSQMIVLGTAFARGGWYIYADLAFSNGNDFVGNRKVSAASAPIGGFTSQFGENSDDSWQTRFNINFGYYF